MLLSRSEVPECDNICVCPGGTSAVEQCSDLGGGGQQTNHPTLSYASARALLHIKNGTPPLLKSVLIEVKPVIVLRKEVRAVFCEIVFVGFHASPGPFVSSCIFICFILNYLVFPIILFFLILRRYWFRSEYRFRCPRSVSVSVTGLENG